MWKGCRFISAHNLWKLSTQASSASGPGTNQEELQNLTQGETFSKSPGYMQKDMCYGAQSTGQEKTPCTPTAGHDQPCQKHPFLAP